MLLVGYADDYGGAKQICILSDMISVIRCSITNIIIKYNYHQLRKEFILQNNIRLQIVDYFNNNMDAYLISITEHIGISLLALMVAIIIGVPCVYMVK